MNKLSRIVLGALVIAAVTPAVAATPAAAATPSPVVRAVGQRLPSSLCRRWPLLCGLHPSAPAVRSLGR